MKTSNKLHIAIASIFSLIFIPLNSCEDMIERLSVDCSNCYTQKPDYFDVELRITIEDGNNKIPVTVYYGSYEDGNVAASDTAISESLKFNLPVDEDYSFKATYKKDGVNYYVINGTKLRARADYESCDETCYYITGDYVDMRKKF